MNTLLILLGKVASFVVKKANLGNGSTWPGHLALKINPNFIRQTLHNAKTHIIIVAGTNGKTTSSALIATLLTQSGKSVLQNSSGANLLNGVASAILLQANHRGKLDKDFAIFEVDENALPQVLAQVTPDYLVLLNLFRDQLDRYGEVRTIAAKWQKVINALTEKTTLIVNADDPEIAFLGEKTKAKQVYFSVKSQKKPSAMLEHAVDSIYCPSCGEKLSYSAITFSHLGIWKCTHCSFRQPKADLTESPVYPLPGEYNQYNTNAAVMVAKTAGIDEKNIIKGLQLFKPAFGRQEEITIDNKHVSIFLSKNPTGFNESLRTIKQLGAKHILFLLNDRIPDGKDVSWIWDTDIEHILTGDEKLYVSGDRVYDMAVRLKYALESTHNNTQLDNLKTYEDLEEAIKGSLSVTNKNETLYIIPTYSAMLDARKILSGRKIL